MRTEYYEARTLTSESPTTQQMRRLALVSMTAAQQYRDLKIRRRYYAYDEFESIDVNEVSNELVGIRQGVGVHLDRLPTGFQEGSWRLRYIKSQRVAGLAGDGLRTKESYNFEWNEAGCILPEERYGLLLARRCTRTIESARSIRIGLHCGRRARTLKSLRAQSVSS